MFERPVVMDRPQLYLVGKNGEPVAPAIADAVKRAYRSVTRANPNVDTALIANWAEQIAASMQDSEKPTYNAKRYALFLLEKRVLDGYRRKGKYETNKGIGKDLEEFMDEEPSFEDAANSKILVDQLCEGLSDRDGAVIALLAMGVETNAEVAKKLGINYDAASKRIRRAKERLATELANSKQRSSSDTTELCEREG